MVPLPDLRKDRLLSLDPVLLRLAAPGPVLLPPPNALVGEEEGEEEGRPDDRLRLPSAPLLSALPAPEESRFCGRVHVTERVGVGVVEGGAIKWWL